MFGSVALQWLWSLLAPYLAEPLALGDLASGGEGPIALCGMSTSAVLCHMQQENAPLKKLPLDHPGLFIH